MKTDEGNAQNTRTRLERLEAPMEPPMKSKPAPQPSAEAQRTAQAINERIARVRGRST